MCVCVCVCVCGGGGGGGVIGTGEKGERDASKKIVCGYQNPENASARQTESNSLHIHYMAAKMSGTS